MMRRMLPLWVCFAGACACTPQVRWTRVSAGTTADLVSVWCTPHGDVYAIDRDGNAHDLLGHAERLPWDSGSPVAGTGERLFQATNGQLRRSTDGGKTWALVTKVGHTGGVSYGRSQITRVAGGGGLVYALGRYMAVSDSLENDFAFLVRADNEGATWPEVWTGPDRGPIGMGQKHGPDVGPSLAVLPDGTVALAADGGAVLVSTDGGRTFAPRRTPATATLADLWASPTGVLYGVGAKGEAIISIDGGESFAAAPSRTAADLAAVTGCGAHVWIVGARGTVLRR
jgi:hypothetical protein